MTDLRAPLEDKGRVTESKLIRMRSFLQQHQSHEAPLVLESAPLQHTIRSMKPHSVYSQCLVANKSVLPTETVEEGLTTVTKVVEPTITMLIATAPFEEDASKEEVVKHAAKGGPAPSSKKEGGTDSEIQTARNSAVSIPSISALSIGQARLRHIHNSAKQLLSKLQLAEESVNAIDAADIAGGEGSAKDNKKEKVKPEKGAKSEGVASNAATPPPPDAELDALKEAVLLGLLEGWWSGAKGVPHTPANLQPMYPACVLSKEMISFLVQLTDANSGASSINNKDICSWVARVQQYLAGNP